MTDLEILQQLLSGNHLEMDELNRAQKLVSQMQVSISQRVFQMEEMTQDFEKWYDLQRDELIERFTEENPEIIRTDEDGQDIENKQQFQDWTDEQFKENADINHNLTEEEKQENFCNQR